MRQIHDNGDGTFTLTNEAGDETTCSESNLQSTIDTFFSLQPIQDSLWADAKEYRDNKMQSGCTTLKGRVDTNYLSQQKLTGAALAAQIRIAMNDSTSIDWTMADNTVVPHTPQEMLQTGMQVVQFIQDCQNTATAIRDQIYSATTLEELSAVDITAGYPQ